MRSPIRFFWKKSQNRVAEQSTCNYIRKSSHFLLLRHTIQTFSKEKLIFFSLLDFQREWCAGCMRDKAAHWHHPNELLTRHWTIVAILFKLSYGKYLAGDVGGTLDLSQAFANGVKMALMLPAPMSIMRSLARAALIKVCTSRFHLMPSFQNTATPLPTSSLRL